MILVILFPKFNIDLVILGFHEEAEKLSNKKKSLSEYHTFILPFQKDYLSLQDRNEVYLYLNRR